MVQWYHQTVLESGVQTQDRKDFQGGIQSSLTKWKQFNIFDNRNRREKDTEAG